MKKTYYILQNFSGSVGQYLLDDEYYFLNPNFKITLDRKPTNCTQNISVSMFRKEVPDIVNENIEVEEPKKKGYKTKKGE